MEYINESITKISLIAIDNTSLYIKTVNYTLCLDRSDPTSAHLIRLSSSTCTSTVQVDYKLCPCSLPVLYSTCTVHAVDLQIFTDTYYTTAWRHDGTCLYAGVATLLSVCIVAYICRSRVRYIYSLDSYLSASLTTPRITHKVQVQYIQGSKHVGISVPIYISGPY